MDATDVEPVSGPVVSCKTAFSCLDRVCGSDVKRMSAAASEWVDDLESGVLSLDRLIAFAKTRGLRLRPTTFDWGGLLIALATKTILLLLKNGNVVAVLGTGREGVEEIVVSDPLYQDGEPFFLPRLALEHAWGGDALIIKPRRSKGERVLAWYFSILSVLGLAAGLLLLSQAAIDVTIAGSHEPREDGVGIAKPEPGAAVVAGDIQLAAAPPETAEPRAEEAAPGANEARSEVSGEAEASRDPTTSAAGETSSPEQRAKESSTASGPISSEPSPGAVQIAVKNERHTTDLPAPVVGDNQQPGRVIGPSSTTASTKPISPALPSTEVAALLARGDALIAKGDVASARLFYERAAEAGDGQAALRLGESYDPAFLAQAHLNGVRGDAVAAANWYRRARELGVAEAETLLQTLAPEKDQRLP